METETMELRTDDLAMATWLNIEGFSHSSLEMKDRRSAQWVFEGDAGLQSAAAEYQAEEALVEPLRFSRTLTVVRRELYQFLEKNRSDN